MSSTDDLGLLYSKALRIAASAHELQKDKAGFPYIKHPIAVSQTVGDNLNIQIVALLHDVPEDTNIGFDVLRAEGFSESILQAIESVTRRIYPINDVEFNRSDPKTYVKEDYEDFVARSSENVWGCIVKMQDLRHNVSLDRLYRCSESFISHMIKKYYKAQIILAEKYIQACMKVYGRVI